MCGLVFPNPMSPFKGLQFVKYTRMERKMTGRLPVFFVAKNFFFFVK